MDIQIHDSYLALDPLMLICLAASILILLVFIVLKFGRRLNSVWINLGLIASIVVAGMMVRWLALVIMTFVEMIKAG
jgi:hypothetical protein